MRVKMQLIWFLLLFIVFTFEGFGQFFKKVELAYQSGAITLDSMMLNKIYVLLPKKQDKFW